MLNFDITSKKNLLWTFTRFPFTAIYVTSFSWNLIFVQKKRRVDDFNTNVH